MRCSNQVATHCSRATLDVRRQSAGVLERRYPDREHTLRITQPDDVVERVELRAYGADVDGGERQGLEE
jgi:hypothetical protein